jgi:hypothetical protein
MLIFRALFFTSNCFFLWWSSDLTSVCSFSVWHNYPLLLGITLARLRLRGPVGCFVTVALGAGRPLNLGFVGLGVGLGAGLPLNFPPLIGAGAGLGAGRPRPLNFPPLGPEGLGGVGLGPLPLNLGFVGLGVGLGLPLNFPPLGGVDGRPLNFPPRAEPRIAFALASARLRAAI